MIVSAPRCQLGLRPTNRPQGGAGQASQLDSEIENEISLQSLLRPKILEHWRGRSRMCSKYSQIKGISPVCGLAK